VWQRDLRALHGRRVRCSDETWRLWLAVCAAARWDTALRDKRAADGCRYYTTAQHGMYSHIRLGFASGGAQQGVVICTRKLTVMDSFGALYIYMRVCSN